MNTKSNIDQARKYEWFSMCAASQGDKDLANRYSSLSKMSMMDAARSYSYENSLNKNFNVIHNRDNEIDLNEFKSLSSILSLVAVGLFFIGIYVIGSII